jgi:predicted ATPase
VVAQLEHAARFAPDESADRRLEKLNALLGVFTENTDTDCQIFSALLRLQGERQVSEIEPDPEGRKELILGALERQIERLATLKPILCVFEDVHWIDASTTEFVDRLVDAAQQLPVLIILTFRPEFTAPWTGQAHVTFMALSRMNSQNTADLIAKVAGRRALPEEVAQQIISRTDGIPLFVEELTRAIIDSNLLEVQDNRFIQNRPLPPLAIPATLQDSLIARLDRLSAVRETAQLAATIGRSFDYQLIAAVSTVSSTVLDAGMVKLEAAGIVSRRGSPPDARYHFKHALIQEAAYQSLLKSTRAEYHERIARCLESAFQDIARSDPGLVAHHYTEAGLIEPAVDYWQGAGERAVETSAFVESIDSFSRALELVGKLPDTAERVDKEISILLSLGVSQVQAIGPASDEVEQTYSRALSLCEARGSLEQRFKALWGLWFFHFMLGDVPRMREFADQLFPLAQELGDPALILEAHHVQWAGLSLVGDLETALKHTEEGIDRYCAEDHHWLTFVYGGHDPGLCARNLNAVLMCLLGYSDQAKRRSDQAVAQALELGHPYTLLEGLFCGLIVALLRGDLLSLRQNAERLNQLASAKKLPAEASGLANGFLGWAVAEQGQLESGLALMRESVSVWQSFWGAWSFPLVAAYVSVLARSGQIDEALDIVDRAIAAVDESGSHWWDAEFYRVRGQILLQKKPDGRDEAKQCFEKAIEIARSKNARFFELRAAKEMAEVLLDEGNKSSARDLLKPIYDWFSEGYEVPDLFAAKATLDELS